MLRLIKTGGVDAGAKARISGSNDAIAAFPIIARKSQEDQKEMSTITAPAPSSSSISTASAARISTALPKKCTICRKNKLSLNNKTGVCGECQERQGGRSHSKRTNGNNGVQSQRGPQLAPLQVSAKPNGADHGVESPRVASRVDLLLAAVPAKDKEKMLAAWMAGAL